MRKFISLVVLSILSIGILSSTASAYSKESTWNTYTYKCPGCTRAAAIKLKTKINYTTGYGGLKYYISSVQGKMSNVSGYSNPYVYDTYGWVTNDGIKYLLNGGYSWPNGYLQGETGWITLGTTNLSVWSVDDTNGVFQAWWSYGSNQSTEKSSIRSVSL